MKDQLPMPKGTLHIKVLDKDGKFLYEETTNNLVVTLGRKAITHLITADVTGYSINQVGFGVNPTATAITDSALTGPPYIKAIGSVTYPNDTSTIINFTLGSLEANGMSINELGLICANGSLFSRVTRGTIVKTSAIQLICTWTLSF